MGWKNAGLQEFSESRYQYKIAKGILYEAALPR